jgi:Flp pilus assembly protein protease CpaA
VLLVRFRLNLESLWIYHRSITWSSAGRLGPAARNGCLQTGQRCYLSSVHRFLPPEPLALAGAGDVAGASRAGLRRVGRRLAPTAVGAAAVAGGVAVRYGAGTATAAAVIGAAALVTLAAIDLHRRRVPNAIVLPAAAVVLALRIAAEPARWWEWTAAAGAAFLVFFVLASLSRGGLGMGDAKLVFLIGALLGPSTVLGLALGTLAGAFAAVVALVKLGSSALKLALPYAPFLAFGALVTLLTARP